MKKSLLFLWNLLSFAHLGNKRKGKKMTEGLMKNKRGLIMGVANDHSIAWGIAKAVADQGAKLAFTFQGEALGKRVRPLAESIDSHLLMPCDVTDSSSMDSVFKTLKDTWGSIDFVVHAIAFSDKNELKGRYVDTTPENFSKSMLISAYSFTEVYFPKFPVTYTKFSI